MTRTAAASASSHEASSLLSESQTAGASSARKTAWKYGLAGVLIIYAVYERSRLIAAVQGAAAYAVAHMAPAAPALSAVAPYLLKFKVLLLSDPRIFLICAGVGLLIALWATKPVQEEVVQVAPSDFVLVLSQRLLALDGAIRCMANTPNRSNFSPEVQVLRIKQQQVEGIIEAIKKFQETASTNKDTETLNMLLDIAKEAANQAAARESSTRASLAASIMRYPYPELHSEQAKGGSRPPPYDENLYAHNAGITDGNVGYVASCLNIKARERQTSN